MLRWVTSPILIWEETNGRELSQFLRIYQQDFVKIFIAEWLSRWLLAESFSWRPTQLIKLDAELEDHKFLNF